MHIQPLGYAVQLIAEQVPVAVQRKSSRGVAQHPLNRLHARTGHDGQRRRGVAQFMRVQPSKPDGCRGYVEAGAPEHRCPDRSADAHAGEDELVIVPARDLPG